MAKLYFKYGAMGSSKTAQALITKYNYEENGMRVWLIKPSADNRDGAIILRSRVGLEAPAEVIAPETDSRELFARQESQYFKIIPGGDTTSYISYLISHISTRISTRGRMVKGLFT